MGKKKSNSANAIYVCTSVDRRFAEYSYWKFLRSNEHDARLENPKTLKYADRLFDKAHKLDVPVPALAGALVALLSNSSPHVSKPTIASLFRPGVLSRIKTKEDVQLALTRGKKRTPSKQEDNWISVQRWRADIGNAITLGLSLEGGHDPAYVIPLLVFHRNRIKDYLLYSVPSIRGLVASGTLRLNTPVSTMRSQLTAMLGCTDKIVAERCTRWLKLVKTWEKEFGCA